MSMYAELLDKAIIKSGMSLTEISRKSEEQGVKITISYLSKLRNGTMPPPSVKVSAVLAMVIGLKPETLIAAGVYEKNQSSISELEEALSFVYPDYNYSQLFERARYISVDPKSVMEDNVNYQADLSEEDVEQMMKDATSYPEFDYIEKGRILNVPVLGHIAAGKPILAEEHLEEWVEIPNLWNLKEGEAFVLEVKGDSMIGSRIFEGDRVVVKIQPDVESGEIAVVNVNGNDATLKRVKKVDGRVILFPDNPKYEPMIISHEKARIIGKVVQVMFEPRKV